MDEAPPTVLPVEELFPQSTVAFEHVPCQPCVHVPSHVHTAARVAARTVPPRVERQVVSEIHGVLAGAAPKRGRVVLLLGGTGSGKSSLLHQCLADTQLHGGGFPSMLDPIEWDNKRSVVSHFVKASGRGSGSADATHASQWLSCAGLNSVPSWCKPYRILSTGERYRADLARRMMAASAMAKPLLALDDFASHLDRQTAAACANNLTRQVRRLGMAAVVTSSCADTAVWLQPDMVVVVGPCSGGAISARVFHNTNAGTRAKVRIHISRKDTLRLSRSQKSIGPPTRVWRESMEAGAFATAPHDADTPLSGSGVSRPSAGGDSNGGAGAGAGAGVVAGVSEAAGSTAGSPLTSPPCPTPPMSSSARRRAKRRAAKLAEEAAAAAPPSAVKPRCCVGGLPIRSVVQCGERAPFEFQHEREPPPPGGVVVCTTVALDEATRMCDALFDNQFDGRCLFRLPTFPRRDVGSFRLGLICGPSGSAKSVLAAHHFGRPASVEWTPGATVWSHFECEPRGVERLRAVGLERVAQRDAMREYATFSKGEQALLNVARVLDTPGAVVDEFTSGVDRRLALAAARGVSAYCRDTAALGVGGGLVLVACYDDIASTRGLAPDWVFLTRPQVLLHLKVGETCSQCRCPVPVIPSLSATAGTLGDVSTTRVPVGALTTPHYGTAAGCVVLLIALASWRKAKRPGKFVMQTFARLGCGAVVGCVAWWLWRARRAACTPQAAPRRAVDVLRITSPADDIASWEHAATRAGSAGSASTVSIPSPEVRLWLRPCEPRLWLRFRAHHYKTASLSRKARCYVVLLERTPGCDGEDGIPVGFAATIRQASKVPRGELPPHRAHRTVVLPDWQGLGIGSRMTEAVGELHRISGIANEGRGGMFLAQTIHPRFGAYRDQSPLWQPTQYNHHEQRLKVENWQQRNNAMRVRLRSPRFLYSHSYQVPAMAEPSLRDRLCVVD